MSQKFMMEAWDARGLSPTARLLALYLGDAAKDDDGGRFDVQMHDLLVWAGINREDLIVAAHELAESGLCLITLPPPRVIGVFPGEAR